MTIVEAEGWRLLEPRQIWTAEMEKVDGDGNVYTERAGSAAAPFNNASIDRDASRAQRRHVGGVSAAKAV
ncbi:MAG: hypothetical protein WD270_05485 [Acetobacterales bacterium]